MMCPASPVSLELLPSNPTSAITSGIVHVCTISSPPPHQIYQSVGIKGELRLCSYALEKEDEYNYDFPSCNLLS
jgi:hypothetical protein